jgi:MinD-like ATPase involved in chromosome partitioning or flagellar assembly
VTVIAMASIKGAPGVTTLACLVGATWPAERAVLVAEADRGGGDLAARFGLSSKWGWSTFVSASRRSPTAVAIAPHLQHLPGGLSVLIGPTRSERVEDSGMTEALLSVLPAQLDGPWDVIADLGRITPGRLVAGDWLERSDVVVIVVRGDAPSILHVKERAAAIRQQSGDRVCLVVVGASRYSNAEIEEFTGVTVAGNVPFEPGAAAVATSEGGSPRRLSRSLLVGSASRLAKILSCADREWDQAMTDPMGAQLPLPIPVERSPLKRIRGSLRVGQFAHSRKSGPDMSSATEVAEVTDVTEVKEVGPAVEKPHAGAHL